MNWFGSCEANVIITLSHVRVHVCPSYH